MSLAIVNTRARVGIDAPLVTCEVHLSGGLPSFAIVGLPEMATKETYGTKKVPSLRMARSYVMGT